MKTMLILCQMTIATIALAQEQKQVLVPADPNGFTLSIQVNGLKVEKDFVLYAQVQNEAKKVLQRTRLPVKATEMKVSFEKLPKGKYAVMLYQDENKNQKLDSNFMGIPTEGWGCSNDARGTMSAPAFKDQLFDLQSSKNIIINLTY